MSFTLKQDTIITHSKLEGCCAAVTTFIAAMKTTYFSSRGKLTNASQSQQLGFSFPYQQNLICSKFLARANLTVSRMKINIFSREESRFLDKMRRKLFVCQ